MNRGWRFCRFGGRGDVVDSSCFLVRHCLVLLPGVRALLFPSCSQVLESTSLPQQLDAERESPDCRRDQVIHCGASRQRPSAARSGKRTSIDPSPKQFATTRVLASRPSPWVGRVRLRWSLRNRSAGMIRSSCLCFSLCSFLFMLPGASIAQEQASIRGTVLDSSSAILPGVTVTAIETRTGRQHVERDRRARRIPATQRALGHLRHSRRASRLSTVVISGVEVLVGQNAAISMRMTVANVQETVTVTGESPLVDVASTQVAGNVDRRQMEELPILGRNWMELALQVQRHHGQQRGRSPRRRARRSVPAQPRRPAGDAEGLGIRIADSPSSAARPLRSSRSPPTSST